MYMVVLEDDTTFVGGTPDNSLWLTMPDKPIKKIDYSYNNQLVSMVNYNGYNHVVERVNVMGAETVTKIMLMGYNQFNGRVDCFTMSVSGGGFMPISVNRFVKSNLIYGKEYQGRPTTGWHKGYKQGDAFGQGSITSAPTPTNIITN